MRQTLKIAIVLLGVVMFAQTATAGESPQLSPADPDLYQPDSAAPAGATSVEDLLYELQVVQAADECCKTCRTGKACGDGCIKKTSTCNKIKGCACDAEADE